MTQNQVRLEVMSTGMLEPTLLDADLLTMLNELNLSAAQGKHFIHMTDVSGASVLLETRNITRVREVKTADAFI